MLPIKDNILEKNGASKFGKSIVLLEMLYIKWLIVLD